MLRRDALRVLGTSLIAGAFSRTGTAVAQATQSVEVVVPAPAGSRTGFLGRLLATNLQTVIGQTVTTRNFDAAADAYGYLSQSRNDGSVIGLMAADITSLHHRKYADVGSMTPIALLAHDPAGVHVRADDTHKNAAMVLETVRRRPGQLKMSGAGRGAIWHLSGVRWLSANSLGPEAMPWTAADNSRSAGELLASGGADVVVCSMYEIRSLGVARSLKTIGVMADKRFGRYPDVPSFAELKMPLRAGIWRGLAGPKNMSGPAIFQLTTALRKVYALPAFQSDAASKGFMTAMLEQPSFATFVTDETAANGEAMRRAGVI
jgi:tripartite-type tricarboxylate transporter receptor subunit TctC